MGVTLRTVCRADAEQILRWENDAAVQRVSEGAACYSRAEIEGFIIDQQNGFETEGQLRFMIAAPDGHAAGCVDLFGLDRVSRSAGVGILVYEPSDRRRGYALSALSLLEEYAAAGLRLRSLWCRVQAGNEASLGLFAKAGYVQAGPSDGGILLLRKDIAR